MEQTHRLLSRREFVKKAGAVTAGLMTARTVIAEEQTVTLPFENGVRRLARFPQKRPLILQTSRPPQLETPFSVFNESLFTPNDAFFVRYHLANIPLSIDTEAYRLEVKGAVEKPLKFSLEEIKKDFEAVEIAAVNQCSGNSRGFSKPRVGGGQSGHGAMGNARWKGARLKDVLDKAGVRAGARQVVCDGLDGPVLPQTPDFVKALEIDHARDGEVLVAYEMNGEPLPMLNGFPLRLVVPGHYGTYWIKHLNTLEVIDGTYGGFYMAGAYRIPATPGGCLEPGEKMTDSVPITRFKIRSFLTSLEEGARLHAGREVMLRGIAFDGGHGITEVLVSTDGGRAWHPAKLGKDHGRYSFREWTLPWKPEAKAHSIQCRAFNRLGESQPLEPLWNPSGYMRNVVETVNVTAA